MIRSFLTVSSGTLASRLLGFARDSLLAALLGAGPVADAFLVAFQLVNVVRRLLTEGALNAALVPAWLRLRETGGAIAAAAFAGRVLGTVSAALIVVTALLGLVSVVAPAVVTGNTAVVLASQTMPLPAVTFGEVLATSDVPGGVVNILTGRVAEVAPWLASHMDVNGIDLTGAGLDAVDLEAAAAENLKRVRRPADPDADWAADPGTGPMLAFLETKTVWHPVGL